MILSEWRTPTIPANSLVVDAALWSIFIGYRARHPPFRRSPKSRCAIDSMQMTRSSLHPCKPSGNVRGSPNDMGRVHVILITTCT